MSKTTGNAVTTNSADASQSAARPAGSQPATGKQDADTGTEVEYDLPSAADVAAFLPKEPAEATDEDADSDVDANEDDEATPEEKAALETAIEEGAEKSDKEEGDDAEEDSDESDDDKESSDDSKDESGDETKEDEADEPAKTGDIKRIGQLTRRAKTAEEEAARLREQLASANYSAPDFGTLSKIDDLSTLETTSRNELALHKWALENETNPEGADLPDGKGGTVHYEPEQIRRIKANTFEVLFAHVPARREYLKNKATAEAEAAQAYPWLRQLKSGDGAEVQAMIEARPYLRQAHDYRTLAADAHIGAKLRKAGVVLDDKAIAALVKGKPLAAKPGQPGGAGKNGAPAKPAAAPIVRRTAPSPSRPGVLPPRLQGREAAARMADKRLQSSDGGLDDIANSIAARMR